MSRRATVILNPYGGRWAGQEKVQRVEQALRTTKIDYELCQTEAPGHAMTLAQQAAHQDKLLVVAGGDGTINEVVNGLLQHSGEPTNGNVLGPIGILPTGTANDLAVMLDLPLDLAAACQRLVSGQTRTIDVGQVNGRYFVNNSAVGLEPMVSLGYEKLRWLRGSFRYIVAALREIASAKGWQTELRWDEGEYTGPMTLVSVGNSRRTGGAFYMTPQAELDDGQLDFVFGGEISRWQMLTLLPKTFNGSHIHHPQVTYSKTTSLSIICSPPTPIQTDGEVIDMAATTITYQISPSKLRVIV